MKKTHYFLLVVALFFGVVIIINLFIQNKDKLTNRIDKPILVDSIIEKDRKWTIEEVEEYSKNLRLVQNSIDLARASKSTKLSTYTDVTQLGFWRQKGPYNQPGAFEFCEIDENNNDVYAVSCGHYGGVQFIWKGKITKNFNDAVANSSWKIINPKHPSRFQDLIVMPNGTNSRIIAGQEMGQIMYSDDIGETWINSTGITGGIFSTVINRKDGIIYATDGLAIFKSTDKGTSFTKFQDIQTGTIQNACLYSPRYDIAGNGYGNVYFASQTNFYKLNDSKTAFEKTCSNLVAPSTKKIGIGGDARKLWILSDEKMWYYSTDNGVSFTYKTTYNKYYSNAPVEGLQSKHYPCVNPEDPNILVGGYTVPLVARIGAEVEQEYSLASYWGAYQNSVGNDNKVGIHYHPDIQASQFFYDKDGTLLNLRSTDGGVFVSYNEWIKTSFPALADAEDVFWDISLFACPSQEAYRGGFIIGKNNINDVAIGTQDQGDQISRLSTYNNSILSYDARGGDGRCQITGDGLIGWQSNYAGDVFQRFNLYDGNNVFKAWVGLTFPGNSTSPGTGNTALPFTKASKEYFVPLVADFSNPDIIWVLTNTLRKVTYSNGEITGIEHDLDSSTNYGIQGIAQSKKTPDIVYALDNGNVFKSADHGDNWTKITDRSITGIGGRLDDSMPNRGMGWSSPNDENIVLFATHSSTSISSIFSKDGGLTWINVTGSGANLFPNTLVNGMAGTSDGSMVFASTAMGPYVFIVDEELWYPLAIESNMPIFYGNIVYVQNYNGKEYARFSTWGQGLWDFEINSMVVANQLNIEKTTNDNQFMVFPNPASDELYVSSEDINLFKNVEISLFDTAGKQVYKQAGLSQFNNKINVRGLKNGIYICKIKSLTSKKTLKIVIKH